MARIDDMKAELREVRQRLEEAYAAAGGSMEGRSLTRQSLDQLRKREAELTWAIDRHYGAGPIGVIRVKDVIDS